MIALLLLALLAAIANVLDTFTDLIAITKGGISPVVFGALNSLSYVVYLVMIIVAGRLADKGITRALILAYASVLLIYFILLNLYIGLSLFLLLLALYGAYPVLQAISRITATAYIHENYHSEYWGKLLSRRMITTLILEALIMITLSSNINYIQSNNFPMMFICIASAVATWLVVKDPVYRFEKPLFRIEAGIRRIESVVMDTIKYTMLTKGEVWRLKNRSPVLTISKRNLSPNRIIASTIVFRLSNALLLVQLPVYLIRYLDYSSFDMLVVYSIAKLILLVDFIVPLTATNKLFTFMLARAALPMAIISLYDRASIVNIAIPLGLIIYLNNKIDVALYSHYIEALGKPESTRFILFGETTSFIATLISGFIIGLIGYNGIVYLTALLLVFIGLSLRM